jgi:hypothetical protein
MNQLYDSFAAGLESVTKCPLTIESTENIGLRACRVMNAHIFWIVWRAPSFVHLA